MANKLIGSALLIEESQEDTDLLREMPDEGCGNDIKLTDVKCMNQAEARLAEQAFDIILLDLCLPDAQGLEAVRRAHAAAPRTPLVVLTGLDDEPLGAQALQEGAEDFLLKGQIDARGLLRVMRCAIERKFMEAALFAEKERAQVTLDCIGDAVICTDAAGIVLRAHECDEAQGYYFSRPVSPDQFAKLLQTGIREEDLAAPLPISSGVVADGHQLTRYLPAPREIAVETVNASDPV